jgi:PAN domain
MQVKRLNSRIQNGVLSALFAFLIVAFAPLGQAFAADDNTLRIGGDYKFLKLREGAAPSECRRACEKDVSCRAWTFIKQRTKNRDGINLNLGPDLNIGFGGRREVIPPQCRLKHTVGPKHDNECCVSGVKRVVERRRPRKAEQCADYAEKSLEQQDINLSRHCGYRGNRWHTNYRTHYKWCMDSSNRRRDKETEVRVEQLRQCNDDRRVRNQACDRYASTAMELIEQAGKNDCRTSNGSWEKEHNRVYEWCLDNRPAKRRQVLQDAQAKLASCIRRGGGERVERCDTYAENALEQVSRANKNDCRTRGQTWSTSFKVHYKACRKLRRRELVKKTQLRTNYINRCIQRGSQARVMETGFVEVRQRNARQWHTVRLTKRFNNPVVIIGPVSANGGDPAHVRVRRVSRRGFEFRIEEFGDDGKHTRETLSYMVVEKGIHRFKGMVIEAGTILTGADLVNRQWSFVDLSNRWRKAPVVLAQTQTFKGPDAVVARIKGVTRRGFEVSLSEQESDRGGHARETIAFVAISQGRHQIEGSRSTNSNLWSGRISKANSRWLHLEFPRRFRGDLPALFATAQSSNGADSFDVRYRRLQERSVQLRLQEEQSKDRETNHTNEVLGVVALPYGNYWSISSSAIDDQVANDPVAPPVVRDRPDGGLLNCRDYSERAVNQFRRSRRLSCNFSGRNWHGDERRHLRWCRNNGLGAASDELKVHRTRLQRCARRAEGRRPPVKRGEWVLLGCEKAAFKRDTDVITVGRSKGRFSALQLRNTKVKVKIYEAKVTFQSGEQQVLPFSGTLVKNGASPSLDLTGNRRFVSSIRLVHKSKLLFPPREGRTCVFGQK